VGDESCVLVVGLDHVGFPHFQPLDKSLLCLPAGEGEPLVPGLGVLPADLDEDRVLGEVNIGEGERQGLADPHPR